MDQQVEVLDVICVVYGFVLFLLYGVMGSGKIEVYLYVFVLLFDVWLDVQVFVFVFEINLMLQFEVVFCVCFVGVFVDDVIVMLYSGFVEGEWVCNWFVVYIGCVWIVFGMWFVVFVLMLMFVLIVVDEEYEFVYKQQEGLCYLVCDLVVWCVKQFGIMVVFGLVMLLFESWWQVEQGCYMCFMLLCCVVVDVMLLIVWLIDFEEEWWCGCVLMGGLFGLFVVVLKVWFECGEQSFVFLNWCGYVLQFVCDVCGWVVGCLCCSVYVVLYKFEYVLCCYYCGWEVCILCLCFECGNVDIVLFGCGMQCIEEVFVEVVLGVWILWIDVDSMCCKGSVQVFFFDVYVGEVDILVGMQMIVKGYDFQCVLFVGVFNVDIVLFLYDFCVSEWLFVQLMQVSGCVGCVGLLGEVMVQMCYLCYVLYYVFGWQDYVGFVNLMFVE